VGLDILARLKLLNAYNLRITLAQIVGTAQASKFFENVFALFSLTILYDGIAPIASS
jgi:hypothetical protein